MNKISYKYISAKMFASNAYANYYWTTHIIETHMTQKQNFRYLYTVNISQEHQLSLSVYSY